jgi:hypothetical protein
MPCTWSRTRSNALAGGARAQLTAVLDTPRRPKEVQVVNARLARRQTRLSEEKTCPLRVAQSVMKR